MVPRLEAARFAEAVAERAEHPENPARSLCRACIDVLHVAGAGLVLMSGKTSVDFVAVSDDVSATVEQMEYTLGEGPCVTAFSTRAPVFAPDLADEGAAPWPEFRRVALAAGVHAVFGFPLLTDRKTCIGALNLYHDRAGALTEAQIADARVVADFATRAVLAWQEAAPLGRLAWQLKLNRNHGVEVHQATGRIASRSGVSIDDALVLLRAYAFSHDRPIGDVATEVASGHLRLD